MIKFNKYHVTDGTTKARCFYSLDGRIDGRKAVRIYGRDYNDNLAKIFKGMGVYENRTDIQTDYFDQGDVTLFEDHPLYAQARARAETLENNRTVNP